MKHDALIYITLDLVGGQDKARTTINKLNEFGRVAAISTIYKRYMDSKAVDMSAKLEFVIHFETRMSVDQCLHLSRAVSEDGKLGLNRQGQVDLKILIFDQVVHMSPKLTLPYPVLHTDPLVIRCASEIWEKYEHPVFLKTLGEISKAAKPMHLIEFYLQGKSLVDF